MWLHQQFKESHHLNTRHALFSNNLYYYNSGNPVESFGLTSKDIETDFDPESYDKAMQNAFSEEYYDEGDDEEKPEFSDLEMEDKGTK